MTLIARYLYLWEAKRLAEALLKQGKRVMIKEKADAFEVWEE